MTFFVLFYEHDPIVRRDIGGFRKAWVLGEHLARLGHRVVVFGPAGTAPPELAGVEAVDIPYVDLPVLRPLLVYTQLFWRPLLAGLRGRPDVIYMRPLNSPLTVLLARLLGARLVLEVNGDSLALYEDAGASRLRVAFVRWMERLNVRGSAVIVALTRGLERTLVARHALPPGRTRVIASAADAEVFRPLDAAVCRRGLGLDVAARWVGFVGAFLAHQGIDTLIDAVPRVLARCPTARFLLVGDGVMRARWSARVERAGLARAVVFTGQVPYRDVPRHVGAMDVCVAPFTGNRGETSPLKVFDYLACGRPVVASAIESVREITEDVPAVVTVPPDDPDALADAVIALLEDPRRAERLGAAGRAWVIARHTWTDVARSIAEVCADGGPVPRAATPPADGDWPVVTVVLLTWNRRRDVLEALDGVARLDYPADRLEVLVRDNGSGDGTEAAVRDWMATAGKVLRRAEVFADGANLGAAGGRNFLAARASADSDFLFLLDDDAVPEPGCLRAMVTLALADGRVGVVGSRVAADHDPRRLLGQAGMIDWRLVRFRERPARAPVDCDYVSSCSLLLRREAFTATGGFDEEYVVYHEDVDFCVRARRAGWRVVFEPRVGVRHKVPPQKARSPHRLYYLFRNKLLFLHKHVAPRRHPLPWLLYGLAWPVLLFAQSVVANRGVRPAELRTIARAVGDGLRGVRGPGPR